MRWNASSPISSLARDTLPFADVVRQQFTAYLGADRAEACEGTSSRDVYGVAHRGALGAARQAVLAMRASDEIGDDAFHRIEEELDWLEMSAGVDAG